MKKLVIALVRNMKKLVIALVLLGVSFAVEACPLCGLGAWIAAHQTPILVVGATAGAVSQVESMTINGIVLKKDLTPANPVIIKPASGVK